MKKNSLILVLISMLCVFGCKNTVEGYKNNFVGKILQGRDDYFSTFIEFTTGTSGVIKNKKSTINFVYEIDYFVRNTAYIECTKGGVLYSFVCNLTEDFALITSKDGSNDWDFVSKIEFPPENETGIFHDPACTCGGIVSFDEISSGEYRLYTEVEHNNDTDYKTYYSKFKMPCTLYGGTCYVSFYAKANIEQKVAVFLHSNTLGYSFTSSPIELTTNYKKYEYLFFINEESLGGNELHFNVSLGTTYIKDIQIISVYDSEFINTKTLSWDLWQSAECIKTTTETSYDPLNFSIYEMTDNSVKVYRNVNGLTDIKEGEHVFFYETIISETGNFDLSFENNSFAQWIGALSLSNIAIVDYTTNQTLLSEDDIRPGLNEFSFTIPEESLGNKLRIYFNCNYENIFAWQPEYYSIDNFLLEKYEDIQNDQEGDSTIIPDFDINTYYYCDDLASVSGSIFVSEDEVFFCEDGTSFAHGTYILTDSSAGVINYETEDGVIPIPFEYDGYNIILPDGEGYLYFHL
ncbi:MAG: hypothetical protein J6C25_12250 [Treponema sp.]|nr:hypothetical protein [Treponema sp.]